MATPGMHQWNKGKRLKGVATFEEGGDIRQDLWEGHGARD
jgi:hypothetical protein